MGQIWNAAKRGEGYQLARDSNITWLIVVVTSICIGLFRFLSGRPLLGDRHRKTDATFLRSGTPGTQLYPKNRPPSRWSYLPEWKRAAIRIGVLVVLLGSWWLYHVTQSHPFIVASAAVVVVTPVGRRVSRRWRTRMFRRVYLNPLAKAAGPVLNIPPGMRADQWVSVSPDLPGLLPNLVKPMGNVELRIRRCYGQWVEPVVRYIPDRIVRMYWWATGNVVSVTKGWGRRDELS